MRRPECCTPEQWCTGLLRSEAERDRFARHRCAWGIATKTESVKKYEHESQTVSHYHTIKEWIIPARMLIILK